MFISVDLPEPDGPMIATYSPRCTVMIDAAQRVNHLGAHLVVALQVVGLDRRVPWSKRLSVFVRRDYGIALIATIREEV